MNLPLKVARVVKQLLLTEAVEVEATVSSTAASAASAPHSEAVDPDILEGVDAELVANDPAKQVC